jgi:hypothetical protein
VFYTFSGIYNINDKNNNVNFAVTSEIKIEGNRSCPRGHYSTFILSLYCPDQSAENESNQFSFIFDVFLINSPYKLLHVLTYSYHEFIHDVNRSEEYFDGLSSSFASDTFFLLPFLPARNY